VIKVITSITFFIFFFKLIEKINIIVCPITSIIFGYPPHLQSFKLLTGREPKLTSTDQILELWIYTSQIKICFLSCNLIYKIWPPFISQITGKKSIINITKLNNYYVKNLWICHWRRTCYLQDMIFIIEKT